MKKLLLILCLVLSTTVFYSCGDDDNNEDPQTETEIIQNAVKGKFYKTGIEAYQFTNNTEVEVWTDIVEDNKYYQYQKATFKVYTEKQYIVIKTSLGEILLYYKVENGKVYLYTDAEKTTNIPNTNKPTDLTEEPKEKPTDPTNPSETKTVLVDGEKQTILNVELSYFGGVTVDRHLTIKLKSEWNVERDFVITFKNFRNENEFMYNVQSKRNLLVPYNQNLLIWNLKYDMGNLTLTDESEVKVLSSTDTKTVLSFDLITADGQHFKTFKGNIEIK